MRAGACRTARGPRSRDRPLCLETGPSASGMDSAGCRRRCDHGGSRHHLCAHHLTGARAELKKRNPGSPMTTIARLTGIGTGQAPYRTERSARRLHADALRAARGTFRAVSARRCHISCRTMFADSAPPLGFGFTGHRARRSLVASRTQCTGERNEHVQNSLEAESAAGARRAGQIIGGERAQALGARG